MIQNFLWELAFVVMEVEESDNIPSISWRPGETSDIHWFDSKSLRITRANNSQPEDEGLRIQELGDCWSKSQSLN
jgi:hypothetical protein